MKTRKSLYIITLILIFCFSLLYVYSVYGVNQSPTIYAVLDSSLYSFKLDAYNTTISFDYDLYFTNPNVYWIWHYNGFPGNTTAVTLVDVWMRDLPNTEALNITISAINANITIHRLFQSKQIYLTAYPPSGESFELIISTPYGQPRYVALRYSTGETVVIHNYISSYREYRNVKNKLCQYFDPHNNKYYLKSPSHSPVDILISWTTEPLQTQPTPPPTPPPTSLQPSQQSQPSVSKFKLITLPIIVFFIALIVIAVLLINYFTCFLGVMCRRR